MAQSVLQQAGAIDDPAETIGHDGKDRADAGEQKHRRHGELNHAGYGDVRVLRHEDALLRQDKCSSEPVIPAGFKRESRRARAGYIDTALAPDKNIRG